MATVEWPGLPKLLKQLNNVANLDCMPLMERWAATIVEGNRAGVLSGRDGFDRPMTPLRYRNGAGRKTSNRRVPNYGTTRHQATAIGQNDNLTTTEYQKLTGPRLAPRGESSRVIKNLHTEIRHPEPNRWEAVGAWFNVISARGVPFLPFHFSGTRRLPRYDLRPVRPKDYEFCLNAAKAFLKAAFLGQVE